MPPGKSRTELPVGVAQEHSRILFDTARVLNKPQFDNQTKEITKANLGYVTSTLFSGTGVNGTDGGRYVTGGLKLTF